MLNTKKFLEICLPLVRRSWEIIIDIHKSIENGNKAGIQWKGESDPVTTADQTVQYIIQNGINFHFPNLKVIGEEKQDTLIKSEFDFSIGSSID